MRRHNFFPKHLYSCGAMDRMLILILFCILLIFTFESWEMYQGRHFEWFLVHNVGRSLNETSDFIDYNSFHPSLNDSGYSKRNRLTISNGKGIKPRKLGGFKERVSPIEGNLKFIDSKNDVFIKNGSMGMCITTFINTKALDRLLKSVNTKVDTIVILQDGDYKGIYDTVYSNGRHMAELANNLIYYQTYSMMSGVARLWNFCLKILISLGYENYLVTADDVAFEGESLSLITKIADNISRDVPEIKQSAKWSWSVMFLMNKKCLDVVGFFDETFFPAFCEDNDYSLRLKLAGISPSNMTSVTIKHGFDAKGKYQSGTLDYSNGKEMNEVVRFWRNKYRASSRLGMSVIHYHRKWGLDEDKICDEETSYKGPFNEIVN